MEVQGSYVVRLYRVESGEISGTVESVDTGEVLSFRSAADLWAALNADSSRWRLPSTDAQDAQPSDD